MKIDLDEFIKNIIYIRNINVCPIEELEIMVNGKKIGIDPKQRADFKFTGLNNKDFIKMFIK